MVFSVKKHKASETHQGLRNTRPPKHIKEEQEFRGRNIFGIRVLISIIRNRRFHLSKMKSK